MFKRDKASKYLMKIIVIFCWENEQLIVLTSWNALIHDRPKQVSSWSSWLTATLKCLQTKFKKPLPTEKGLNSPGIDRSLKFKTL